MVPTSPEMGDRCIRLPETQSRRQAEREDVEAIRGRSQSSGVSPQHPERIAFECIPWSKQ